MSETKYACTGSCGGTVSEEEFATGRQTCAADGCDKHGQPLQKKVCDETTGTCTMPAGSDEKSCGCGDQCQCERK